MDRFGVQLAFEEIARQRAQWHQAQRDFNKELNRVMKRMLHEAAANRMSVEQISKMSGLSRARIRVLMRDIGLDTMARTSVLADTAAKALAENAELMGVEPSEIDLLSPLAYLPMGSNLRNALLSEAVKKGADFDEADSQ